MIDRGEQVLGEVGDERADGLDVAFSVAGIETTEKVAAGVSQYRSRDT